MADPGAPQNQMRGVIIPALSTNPLTDQHDKFMAAVKIFHRPHDAGRSQNGLTWPSS